MGDLGLEITLQNRMPVLHRCDLEQRRSHWVRFTLGQRRCMKIPTISLSQQPNPHKSCVICQSHARAMSTEDNSAPFQASFSGRLQQQFAPAPAVRGLEPPAGSLPRLSTRCIPAVFFIHSSEAAFIPYSLSGQVAEVQTLRNICEAKRKKKYT